MILLFTAAVIFATFPNFLWVSEIISVGAYFALVLGVLFQLGNLNFKNIRKAPIWIKKPKGSLQNVLLEKNKKEGARFHGSG
jgi:hypothetical protein